MIPSESWPRWLCARRSARSSTTSTPRVTPAPHDRDDEETILDASHQLAYYRRYADRRFYKGADYVNFIETLAQRRAPISRQRVPCGQGYLCQCAAALRRGRQPGGLRSPGEPGDTLMGMDLYQGGHLTHGCEFNISGKRYTCRLRRGQESPTSWTTIRSGASRSPPGRK